MRILFIIVPIAMLSLACGAPERTSGAGTPPETVASANTNSGGDYNPKPAKPKYYSAVYALKGNRMPYDSRLAAQRREFRHALMVSLDIPADRANTLDWKEKFRDPVSLKLKEGEQVLVITFVSAAGNKLEKGIYEAIADSDVVERSPKDKNYAIVTLVDPGGVKRLKGKINVSDAGSIIMYSFEEKPDVPGLDSMTYGAPLKN